MSPVAATPAVSPALAARSGFAARQEVSFRLEGRLCHGRIMSLGPKRARVACADGRQFRVPYRMLNGDAKAENAERLAEIEAEAKNLLVKHGLDDVWSFRFDQAPRRGGCCNYQKKTIQIATGYALKASSEEVTDTLLHEIAHALVGKRHGHDRVWQETAQAIGCSGNTRHNVSFTPPRWLAECRACGWKQAVLQRKRNSRCAGCSRPVGWKPYDEEEWQEAKASGKARDLRST